MKVIAIAAVGKNGVIGNGSELPWNIPEDMKFFRDATKNHIVIMGRKTFESLGKPLPNRENAIITRDKNLKIAGVKIFFEIKEAIQFYRNRKKEFSEKIIFIIGGAQIYEAAFDLLDEVWLTEIESRFNGDVFFPFYSEGKLQRPEFELKQSRPQADLASPHRYQFNEFHRKN